MLSALTVVGCGGGGDGPPHSLADGELAASAAPSTQAPDAVQTRSRPAGAWLGMVGERVTFGFVLSDGSYHLLYSPPGDAQALAGFMHGRASLAAGGFRSPDGRDFAFSGAPRSVEIYAAIEPGQSLIGSVSASDIAPDHAATSPTVGDASAGDAAPPAIGASAGAEGDLLLRFVAYSEAPPTLPSVAGRYAAQSSLGASGTLTIDAHGALLSEGDPNVCRLSGQLTARADDHALDVTLAFEGPQCSHPGQSFTGAAFFHPASQSRLYFTVTNPVRDIGVVFVSDRT
ncbi:hypothetical protein WG922_11595 [Ramlibacter sp. AN1015]|uniref:hypothetical protein n=1 Tax=Ramlibacter sp. AN1015 TaxID=3133428 RepID=UPI0030C55AEC